MSKIYSLFDILSYNANKHIYSNIMFDPNFTPPKKRIAETETTKRIKIIENIILDMAQL